MPGTIGPVQFGLFDEPAPAPLDTGRASTPTPARVTVIDVRGAEVVGGARFGELLHGVLASAPVAGDRDAYRRAADVYARILGSPDVERDAAVEAALRVAGHDLMKTAAAAQARGHLRRECPVTFTMLDGTLLEGVVDLAFEEGGEWMVVDFKTDREISQVGFERYSRQVAMYAAASSAATGRPASAFLVRV